MSFDKIESITKQNYVTYETVHENITKHQKSKLEIRKKSIPNRQVRNPHRILRFRRYLNAAKTLSNL